VVFFGLQYFLQKYLEEEFGRDFFGRSEYEVAAKYQRRLSSYLGPDNTVGDEHIRALHRLGYLPLQFCALPEGTRVPLRVPMFTVENTQADFFWLTNYIETVLSSAVWRPCTSATLAGEVRSVLEAAASRTGVDPAFVDWQGHDFSFRGMAGPDDAALSGAGHLVQFTGTDTVPALDLVEDYYGPLPEGYLIGASVPATEHSVMCAGGESSELETFSRILDTYPKGIVSVVSDTWDLWNVLTVILPTLKGRIMARDGKLVIRPDSGDPVKIVCGDPAAPEGSPAYKGVVELLWDIFGGTMTSTSHRVLDPHVGAIYGDSITKERAGEICHRLALKGFASSNIVFGVGSFTYCFNTRDTFGFALKSTWVEIFGLGRPIFKAPKTGDGMKNSARGRVAVVQTDAGLTLVENASEEQQRGSLLQPVWRDGRFIRRVTFPEVRANARRT